MTKKRQTKNKVKSVAILCLAALAVFCLLCTCAQPTESDEGDDATVTITIGGGSRGVLPWDSSIDTAQLDHAITMTNDSGSNVEKTGVKAEQTVQLIVTPGHWNISVKAYFNGRLVAEGSTSVNLKRGRNHSVPITMGKPSGKTNPYVITLTVPSFNREPVTTIETDQYTGTVEWSPTVTGKFEYGTIYTATITLTLKDTANYTFDGLTADSFTVTGATSTTYTAIDATSGTVTAVFPETPLNVSTSDDWTAARTLIQNGGNNKTYTINITYDFLTDTTMSFGTVTGLTVNIQGNHTITLASGATTSALLTIDNQNQTVNLKEVSLRGHSANTQSLVFVVGVFNMESGSISGNTCGGGGGGGGVGIVTGGTFTMKGNAKVYDNVSLSLGGGVYVQQNGTFIMQGNAEVYRNRAVNGGGVYVTGAGSTFIMQNDSSVHDNEATGSSGSIGGGGVNLISSAILTMQDNASVYGNRAANRGGGVNMQPGGTGVTGTLNMKGGTIYGNTGNQGGGVYGSNFNLEKGIINGIDEENSRRNNATNGGAALYGSVRYGTFTGANGAFEENDRIYTTDLTIKVENGVLLGNVNRIGDEYKNNISIDTLTIHSNVIEIQAYAFDGCTNLVSVTFAGTIPSNGFHTDAFSSLGDLRDRFYATDSDNGTPGTYTRPDNTSNSWTKQ